MKKLFLSFLLVVALVGSSFAGELESLTDQFYEGLSQVIEKNMDNADACVESVNEYFASNQAKVLKIRELSKAPMEQAMQMMDKEYERYASMSEEELDALEAQAQNGANNPWKDGGSGESAAMSKYNEIMEEFTQKYPMHAMKIAGKMMELVPGFNG